MHSLGNLNGSGPHKIRIKLHPLLNREKNILKYTKIDVGMPYVASKCHRDDPRLSQNRDGGDGDPF